MNIKFCGADRTVTGSSHLLELDDGFRILLDCGLYQGREDDLEMFNGEWLFEPGKIDAVILSHAHIDHSGRLPKLTADGYDGKIYCTHATYDLCSIMLQDSAHIQVKEAEYTNRRNEKKGKGGRVEPLYNIEDARKCMDHFFSAAYGKWFRIHPDVDVLFLDNGHILGSASVTLRVRRGGLKDMYFGFTGDIGRPNRPILKDPVPMPPCDYLICESTYGDKFHQDAPADKERILQIVTETCVEKRGKLIIPAFSVGRTQEIVYMLDQLETEGRFPERIPVYVDSPLAVNATQIFRVHPECFDKDLIDYMHTDPHPFGFDKLKYITEVDDSKRLNNVDACVVISASGMITAGRIKHHVYNNISDPRSTIMIVGYCAPYTIGAQLASGKKEIYIFGQRKEVHANIEVMGSFSAHGDQGEMMQFLNSQQKDKLRKIWLVHGDYKRQTTFSKVLSEAGYNEIVIPELGESFRL